jgi:hypothetical protein
MCFAVLVLCVYGRKTPAIRSSFSVFVVIGGLFVFFAAMLLLLIGLFPYVAWSCALAGAFALAVGMPVMHLGAKKG